ncbi:deoxynucleoside kinase [Jeotgalibacillus salarius]|uniref:Deoxynucleoside kinase n=1 Tax=Jeotgalibacillus salarius TaxID=546023 RepID=A0A4Y8L3A7_9BACL|nr:deoxynucleoside kinase [Jeotgalibacillus salarius]TFD96644.1 deoxynucleoside kinase [Jeotgalibacillus salarius]
MTTIPFITVEGPIGVGKTSLAKAISSHFDFHLLKEIVDENPFLDKFYSNIDEWSFQTEMYFLCNRYKQLSDIQRLYLSAQKPVAADYHIFKNIIFAKRTLRPEEYDKYLEIYRILTADMPKPNVVVYLHASLETLLKRVKLRGRDFERDMSPLYLEQLSADYEEFIYHFEKTHPEIPVLRINGDDIDFVNYEQDLGKVLQQVEESLLKRSTTL